MNLEDNVLNFLEISSSKYAEIKKQEFMQNIMAEILEKNITSPIEKIFFISFHLFTSVADESVNAPDIVNDDFSVESGYGLHIYPQHHIGKYRVDFLLTYRPEITNQNTKSVVVELDGHEFHDKDKSQRAYEKARDRYLVSQGFSVLHYTGSEVVNNPIKVVSEAISLTGWV